MMWGVPKIRGTLFGGPHNKDYSIWGSILGSHYFWETTMYSFNAQLLRRPPLGGPWAKELLTL